MPIEFVRDGTQNTVQLVEAPAAVDWSAPRDVLRPEWVGTDAKPGLYRQPPPNGRDFGAVYTKPSVPVPRWTSKTG